MKGRIRRRSKNSWELTIDLGRDAQGRRQRKFLSVRGKKADADRRLREVLASLDRGLPLDEGRVTLGEFLQRWIRDYAEPHTKPRTAERYESDVRLHIIPAIGHVPLAQLRPTDIQALETQMLKEGRAAASVKHLHTVLKEALKYAMRWGLTYRNVADAVDPPRTQLREVDPPNINQVQEILELAEHSIWSPADIPCAQRLPAGRVLRTPVDRRRPRERNSLHRSDLAASPPSGARIPATQVGKEPQSHRPRR